MVPRIGPAGVDHLKPDAARRPGINRLRQAALPALLPSPDDERDRHLANFPTAVPHVVCRARLVAGVPSRFEGVVPELARIDVDQQRDLPLTGILRMQSLHAENA